MIKKNFLKEKLSSGVPTIGTWVTIPSEVNTEIISLAGLDFIIIDQEHGPISFETAQNMAISAELHLTSPIMRVGEINKALFQNALDIGVHGIQIPNVESKEDVLKIIEFSKYPPLGDRGLSPFTRSGGFNRNNSNMVTSKSNENTLIILNIEGKGAIENLDEILEISDFDVIFIGLFDLSKSLGIPGEVEDKRVFQALEQITEKTRNAGKIVGTIATSKESAKKFINLGISYIVYLVDCDVLRNSYQEIVEFIKN